jgi:hypothetical protein
MEKQVIDPSSISEKVLINREVSFYRSINKRKSTDFNILKKQIHLIF